jgi:predicted membrane metal-binding protein
VLERWRLQRFLRYVFGAIVVSAAVQLVLLPQLIVYFHRLSLSSLVLNIVVSVLLTVLAGSRWLDC